MTVVVIIGLYLFARLDIPKTECKKSN
jgi:hypothetical protein